MLSDRPTNPTDREICPDCEYTNAQCCCKAMSDKPAVPQAVNFMQQLPGGLCFVHGPYKEGFQCPHWNDPGRPCITEKQKEEYIAMSKPSSSPERCPTCQSGKRDERLRVETSVLGLGSTMVACCDQWHDDIPVAVPAPVETNSSTAELIKELKVATSNLSAAAASNIAYKYKAERTHLPAPAVQDTREAQESEPSGCDDTDQELAYRDKQIATLEAELESLKRERDTALAAYDKAVTRGNAREKELLEDLQEWRVGKLAAEVQLERYRTALPKLREIMRNSRMNSEQYVKAIEVFDSLAESLLAEKENKL
jgi:hypothetical protein